MSLVESLLGVSEKWWVFPPKSSNFNRDFQYKSSIFGVLYPYFWKHPLVLVGIFTIPKRCFVFWGRYFFGGCHSHPKELGDELYMSVSDDPSPCGFVCRAKHWQNNPNPPALDGLSKLIVVMFNNEPQFETPHSCR